MTFCSAVEFTFAALGLAVAWLLAGFVAYVGLILWEFCNRQAVRSFRASESNTKVYLVARRVLKRQLARERKRKEVA